MDQHWEGVKKCWSLHASECTAKHQPDEKLGFNTDQPFVTEMNLSLPAAVLAYSPLACPLAEVLRPD